ncbi:MAG TPA: Gldg family protein [Rhodanobacteraceae bacterium]|nr:Gldg family protein [Rhodanobacteraceae bacterium]
MRLHSRWRGRLWLLLPILAAAYVLLVLGASRFFGGERIDLTRDHLYTLSPGTRNIIAHLNQPIDLTLYFSDRASRGLPQLRAYHQHVLHMLEQVARRSHGRVHLTRIDPLPFSDDEDRATAAGLTSVRGEGTGESIFFGLAGRNAGDGRTSSIPFFLPAKEPFLEYDVARLLHDLSITREPRVAIYSGLPIWGGTDAEGTASPAWTALQQVQQLFDVQRLDPASLAALAPGDAAVLVLIQPAGLTHADLRAVNRYVQDGGRLLVFVDPDSEVDGGEPSDLHALFQAWGVAFDADRVLLDRSRALSVQSPVTGATVRDPSVLGLTGDELNRRDLVTQALSVVDVASSGYFGLLPEAQVRLDPLVQSTTEAMVVPAQRVRQASDPASLYKDYAPDGEHYAIAVRLDGKLPDAFAGDESIKAPAHKAEVILVGDTDLLSDRLWVLPSSTEGQTLMSPFASNGDFFVNAIDDLAGPSNLIAIRGRAVNERRFTRVDMLRRQADEKFKAKQIELQAELEDTEKRLATLKQGARERSRSAAQKAAVAQFTQRKLAIRSELRAVQRSLDADIERLSMQLKFIDILAMPILVALVGLLYGLWRMRRRASGGRWR